MFGGKNGFFYRTDLDIFGVTGEGGRGGGRDFSLYRQ